MTRGVLGSSVKTGSTSEKPVMVTPQSSTINKSDRMKGKLVFMSSKNLNRTLL